MPLLSYGSAMHLFLIIWSCIVGTAAVSTLALSAATYARVRRASAPPDAAAVEQLVE